VTYLEKLLNEKPDDRAESGVVFDREAYLRDVEGFDDREVSSCALVFRFRTFFFDSSAGTKRPKIPLINSYL
jgi:hypothetical protein